MFSGATRSFEDHIIKKGGVKALKNAVIYGANAGGKTSFISAIKESQDIITKGLDFNYDLKKMYCRIDENNINKPTYFEYLIETCGSFYYYGFEIILSKSRIMSEWLVKYYPLGKGDVTEETVFEREYKDDSDEIIPGTLIKNEDRTRFIFLKNDMIDSRENCLALKYIGIRRLPNCTIINDVFEWFRDKLFIDQAPVRDIGSLYRIGKMLQSFDTDIREVKIKEISDNESKPPNVNLNDIERQLHSMKGKIGMIVDHKNGYCYKLVNDEMKIYRVFTIHQSNNSEYSFTEESSGTQQAFRMSTIMTSNSSDETYIVDEYGLLMHPLLAYRFIQEYQKYDAKRSSQLIIATHHVSLLTLDLYRRDEIWFIDKKAGSSELYSLEEFQERFDKKLSKAYLEGRYGGLPLLSELPVELDS